MGYDDWKTDDTELDRNEAVSWRKVMQWRRCRECDERIFAGVLCAACWYLKMELDKANVREWLKDSDGYRIMDGAMFRAMGLDVVDRSHSDDASLGKYAAMRSDGRPGEVSGVSEFRALVMIANRLNIPFSERSNFMALRVLVLDRIGWPEEDDE